MILMQLKDVVKSFAGEILLNKINIEVKSNDRIAIVGRNGAGKSTLLKMITGELDYDEGEIIKTKTLEIGYLAQHNDLSSEYTIWDEMLTVFTHFFQEEKELTSLATEIEKKSINGSYDEKLIHEYSRRQEQFEQAGGYRFKSDVKGVLIGLGFPEADFNVQVNELSGGQKTRLALGKLLLQKPDLLILDEPTNHLDISTLTWLENYLSNYEGSLIIVSHDRYFLDKIVNIVYEVTHQQTFKYYGSYSTFLQQKSFNYERQLKMYEKQQQEIKEMEQFIQRNIARASTTKRAQSRRKQLEKMDRMEKPLKDQSSAAFSFQVEKTSGNDVLEVNDLTFTHAGEIEPLFTNVSFTIHRGERIALIGENGVGKTTLLKAIMQDLKEVKLGTNVKIGYYAQEQETLQPTNTILSEVWDDFPNKTEQEIRTVLGNFLFSGEDIEKFVYMLSGGEKARVALAKLMLQQANFLILDEPTNHLDLVSKEVLESALQNFSGTILFVSHDRYFINKIADQVFELQPDGLSIYLGDYDYYIMKKTEEAEIEKLEEKEQQQSFKKTPNTAQLSFSEQKRRVSEQRTKERKIKKLENTINQLEIKLHDVEETMTRPEIFNDHEKLLELTDESTTIKNEIDELMNEWTTLQEAIEDNISE